MKYNLFLNTDGTFIFHSYDQHDGGIPPEVDKYGKGTWTYEKRIIYFSANPNHFDDKFTLNFKGSKARFDTKSPRDKSNKVVKTSIRFLESEIPWITRKVFLKK